MKKLFIITFVSVLLLSACGPEPAPTMSVQDIQSTAVAAAMTMVAQTQAAIPTSTPVPPTETASPTLPPTNTVAPLVVPTQPQQLSVPTQPVAAQPTATSSNDCNHYLTTDAAGPTSPIRIVNETKAPVNVSLYLDKTVFGECGYRGYSVPKHDSITIEFPQGNIYGYAWILEPINATVSGGPWRPNNTDKWEIWISEGGMKFVGP